MHKDTGEVRNFLVDEFPEVPEPFIKMTKEEERQLTGKQKATLLEAGSLYLPRDDKVRRLVLIRNYVDEHFPHLNRKQKREKVAQIKKKKPEPRRAEKQSLFMK